MSLVEKCAFYLLMGEALGNLFLFGPLLLLMPETAGLRYAQCLCARCNILILTPM